MFDSAFHMNHEISHKNLDPLFIAFSTVRTRNNKTIKLQNNILKKLFKKYIQNIDLYSINYFSENHLSYFCYCTKK